MKSMMLRGFSSSMISEYLFIVLKAIVNNYKQLIENSTMPFTNFSQPSKGQIHVQNICKTNKCTRSMKTSSLFPK